MLQQNFFRFSFFTLILGAVVLPHLMLQAAQAGTLSSQDQSTHLQSWNFPSAAEVLPLPAQTEDGEGPIDDDGDPEPEIDW